MLKNFDDRIRELFDEHDIHYARAFARSSNVFYNNYDLYVKKEQEFLGRLLVAKAKAEVDRAQVYALKPEMRCKCVLGNEL
jgi:hypothetical protein